MSGGTRLTFGTVAMLFAGSIVVGVASASSTEIIDEFSVTVPDSCSLSGQVDAAHSANIKNGIYLDDIGETTFTAFCNDAEGFSVYAVGFSGDEYGDNSMRPSNVVPTNAIITGLATSGDISNWSMKIAALSENFSIENNFGSYHIVPDEYLKVASYPSNTVSSSGVQLKSTYATFISGSQPADTYTGKVKYTVVHPSDADAPLRKTIEELTYLQEFNILSSADRAAVVASMSENTKYYLTDVRDSRSYAIAKLKDGNVWMAENLDLGRTALTEDLTSTNTNISNTVSAATFNSWKTTNPSSSTTDIEFFSIEGNDAVSNVPYGSLYNIYAATGGLITTTTYTGLISSDICPAGWRMPTGGDYGEYLMLSNYYNTSALMRAPIESGGASFPFSGNFTRGTPTVFGNSGSYWSTTRYGKDRIYELHLTNSDIFLSDNTSFPYGLSMRCVAKKPIKNLTFEYGTGVSAILFDDAVIADGSTLKVEEGTIHRIGVRMSAEYGFNGWSATAGAMESSDLQYTIYTIGAGNATLTANGTSVNATLQDLSSNSCTTTASLAKDSRDGHVYTIKRLEDGKCWMIDNLDLGQTTLTNNLTSSDTNISSTITASAFNGWRKTAGSNSYTVGDVIPLDGADYMSGTAYGTLYNYYAASGGTINTSTNYKDAEFDICPAGWRLPYAGQIGEFATLYNNPIYNSYEKMRASIADGGAAFALAGFDTSLGPSNQNIYGFFWTSTYKKAASMTYLAITNNILPNGTGGRGTTVSIRCVKKEPSQTLTINYGSGITEVFVDDTLIANGGTVTLEGGTLHKIGATVSSGYGFNSWSATSGTFEGSSEQYTSYVIGTTSTTLTASASAVVTEMQNLSHSSCTSVPSKVKDNRDNHVYTIQRLADGNCWMMDNLDLGRNELTTDLTSSNTNLSSTVSAGTFNGWKVSQGSSSYLNGEFIPIGGGDYTSGNAYGSIYNMAAASAGTITGDSNSNNAEYDICPAGWRLPSGGDYGEFRNLYGLTEYNSYEKIHAPASSSGGAFALAGYATNSTPSNTGAVGYAWSSSKSALVSSSAFYLAGSSQTVKYSSGIYRYALASVRCILKNPIQPITVSFGSGVSNVTIDGVSFVDGDMVSLEQNTTHLIGVVLDGGYGFNGWSTTSGTIGTLTQEHTTYIVSSSSATLSVSASAIATEMQNMSSSNCTSAPSKVKDNRDNHVYTIQLLKDGKCWMMDNLDLGRNELTTDLTSSNTNLSSTVSAATFNDWKKTTTTNDLSNGGEFVSVDGGDTLSGNAYGTLYNYHAATAGTISGATASVGASYDICPAGWRLPTGGSSGEFKALYNVSTYNGYSKLRTSVAGGGAAFALAGLSNNGLPSSQGSLGYYWSSTRQNDTADYMLKLDNSSGSTTLTSGAYRHVACSIRCVLK